MSLPPQPTENGNGGGAKRGGWVSSRRPDPESTPRPAMTPEQGCVSCSAGVGLLLVAFLFWAFMYWRYEPNFHPPGTTPPIPWSRPQKPAKINGRQAPMEPAPNGNRRKENTQ